MLTDEARRSIERRALEIAKKIEATDEQCRRAQVAGRACWYLIETGPGAERKAMQSLADRGFGVFLPEFAGNAKRFCYFGKTIEISASRLIFPRYLFLFVWGIEANWRRVLECPGVSELVHRDGQPIVIPNEDIDRLQALQFAAMRRPSRRALRRMRHVSASDAHYDDETIKVSTRLFWSNVADIGDDQARVASFRRAMGLAT